MLEISVMILALVLQSCASTGPSITKAELAKKNEEFNLRFFQASGEWLPRVYRVGYQLVRSPVPAHKSEKADYNFVGVGVDELKDYGRQAYGIDKKVRGVLVRGVYPGSKAELSGLKAGDVITKIDGKKTENLGAYFKAIRKTNKDKVKAAVWRRNEKLFECELPVEKVYYNAQFFLAPTPNFDASALFSRIDVGIGALRYSKNDDELGVIMGHELAHVTLKHSAKKLGAGVGMGLAYGLAAATVDAFTLPGVGQAIMNPAMQASQAALSRRYEREADYFGMRHAFHSGYDVENGAKVFARLGTDAPGFEVLAYTFSTHPNTPERTLRLEKTVEEFKTQYPDKMPMTIHENWEVVIPVATGESLEEALERMVEAKNIRLTPAVQASVRNTEPPAPALVSAVASNAAPAEQKPAFAAVNVFEDFELTTDKL
ncbi:MAG: M48 family metallopeptidase [Candidatus Omnitrophica bacterium]|nr:M48 family metallopeptidase [Candidatus Omnitrophota bacterium]MDD5671627.1 M48 family metallopeptidase [Candidatus Omnitrophota bacterium]